MITPGQSLSGKWLENVGNGGKKQKGGDDWEGWGKFSSWLCSAKGLKEPCDPGRDRG